MRFFLQMRYEFIPKIGIGFAKYLIAFCMLLGMQLNAFAQYSFLNVPAGTKVIKEGVVSVKPGDDLTLTVPGIPNETQVKWEYRTKPKEPRKVLEGERGASITVSDIQSDIEYIASYKSPFQMQDIEYRLLISCASINVNTDKPCPSAPISINLKGGQFADGRYEKNVEGPRWENLKQFSSDEPKPQWIISADRDRFKVRVSLEYGYYSSEKGRVTTNEIEIVTDKECKASCLTTTTGDFYVGTDFDPNKDNASKVPQDIVNHFGDYNIELKEADIKGYWLDSNTVEFFGAEQVPLRDKEAGVVGKNNYWFCQSPNARAFELVFTPASAFVGKNYTYKMRMYLQKEKNCNLDPNAMFIARTGQGNQTTDHLEAVSYWNSDGTMIKKAESVSMGDMAIKFQDLVNFRDLEKDYSTIMVEITFDGLFPDDKYDPRTGKYNGLDHFSFFPEFAQMNCWKIAVDYISAEIEDVCLSPNVLCAGETTTAHAAGLPADLEFRWYKKVGDNWVEDVPNHGKQNAQIVAEAGITQYQMRVNVPRVGEKTIDFAVSGNDCAITPPTRIDGGTFCLPNVQAYSPNIVDESKEAIYSWKMYRPDGSLWYDSDTSNNKYIQVGPSHIFSDPESDAYKPNKNDSLTISLGLNDTVDVPEGKYKLELYAKTNGVVQTVLDTIVNIYRTPDVTLKLLSDKYSDGMAENDKKLCPSDKRREIISFAENSFTSPNMSNYVYRWNSVPGTPGVFTPDPKDPTKATVDISAIPNICDGTLSDVEFSVEVSIDRCKDTDKNKYDIEALAPLKIYCDSLAGRDKYNVVPKTEYAKIRVPIPTFDPGCDSDPDIIIDYKSQRTEVSDTMGTKTIIVRKSQVDTISTLKVTLPWGKYDFKYTIKDGCGRSESCTHVIEIEMGGVDIDCEQILDLDVINGDYNASASGKCNAKFDAVQIPIPELEDLNDILSRKLLGKYAGRQHFDSKQDKHILMSSEAARAKFSMSVGLYDEYEIDYTYILWEFENAAQKKAWCVQEVLVRDTIKPDFDCDAIDPKIFRPETESGKCSITFKEFWGDLAAKKYTAYDYCPEPTTEILGSLHTDSLLHSPVDEDTPFSVGVPVKIYWQFRDRHDNVTSCPQIINVISSDSVDIDCQSIAEVVGNSTTGTCFAPIDSLNIPSPVGVEPCTGLPVPGVGTRSDGKDLTDDYPTGDTYITWVFEGENSRKATCVTHVLVRGSVPPRVDCERLFPKRFIDMTDCEPSNVTLIPQSVPDPCVADYMIESLPNIAYKDESLEKIDTVRIGLDHVFNIGETIVIWEFWEYTHTVSTTCDQSIHLRDTIAPRVDCDTMKDSRVVLTDQNCDLPSAALRDSLGQKIALEACTGDTIYGEPYLYDKNDDSRKPFDDPTKVGIYDIIWVFANDSLTTKESSCIKVLEVLSDNEPIFNCNELKPLTLIDSDALCKIKLNESLLPIPEAEDYCVPKSEYVVYGHAYIQIDRTGEYKELAYYDTNNHKAVYLMDIPFGMHNVKWVFKSKYSIKPKECIQTVYARSNAIDSFSCNDLSPNPFVYEYSEKGDGPTFDELVAKGLKEPVIKDPCFVIKKEYTRNDGKDVYKDVYPYNSTTIITWLVIDTTVKDFTLTGPNAPYVFFKECQTQVQVVNGNIGTPECPPISGTFLCEDDVNSSYPPYTTVADFIAAGGTIKFKGENREMYIVSISLESETKGSSCTYDIIRTYTFKDNRSQTASCSQTIHVDDTAGPNWIVGASDSAEFECSPIDFFPNNLKAQDPCVNTVYTEPLLVKKFDNDLKDGVFYTIESDHSDDPRDCNYYNYYETRRYIAYDKCNNKSSELVYKSVVIDTFKPVVNDAVIEDWKNILVVADYGVPCKFYVPDLRNSLPSGAFTDKCDPENAKYFEIDQKPAPGTLLNNMAGNQKVTLYIKNPCDSITPVEKDIYVPTREEVVHVSMDPDTVCAERGVELMNLMRYGGTIYKYNPNIDEYEWSDPEAPSFMFYRGSIDSENLIFSTNKYRPGKELNTEEDRLKAKFDRIDKTDEYFVVIEDTVRFCTDTTSAFITVRSRPTISLDSALYNVCDRDSLHLISDDETMFDKFNVEVESNGYPITEQGWYLNGEVYEPQTLLHYSKDIQTLRYYAINQCDMEVSPERIKIKTKERISPDDLMLVTNPQDKPRVLLGENANLHLITKAKPKEYKWYRVEGVVDGRYDEMFDKEGNVREEFKQLLDDEDEYLGSTYEGEAGAKDMPLVSLGDTAAYYVLLIDSVCPAVPSNVVSIDVVKQLPTAFTPHNTEGLNDVFLEGHHVIIFNRYGQKMVESDNGWDGTCRGALVDPGVYFYEVVINDNEKHRGSIEVVYFK